MQMVSEKESTDAQAARLKPAWYLSISKARLNFI